MANLLKTSYAAYVKKSEPLSLIHFITNKCNARCTHCFLDFDDLNIYKGEMTIEEIRELSKHMGNSLVNVNLTGGEPFLRRDIFDIVHAYFTNAKIRSIFITTNGMFTEKTKQFIDQILACKDIEGNIIFSLSIDNFEELHDQNRRVKGLYKNAMATYKTIQGYQDPRIMANIAITITHHNYENAMKIYEHLQSQGVTALTATIMREEGIVKTIDPEIKKKIHAAYVAVTNRIRDDLYNGKNFEGYKGFQGTLMNSKNVIVNKIIQDTYLDPKFVSYCSAGRLFGVIYSNGDVYPCEILSDKKLGNLRDYKMDFMKLWEDHQAKEFKRWVKDTKCNCTFECAWSINVISDPQFIPALLYHSVRSKI